MRITSQSFCIDGKYLEPAAIAMLHKKHSGALPISIEWKIEGGKVACVVWWCPPPNDAEPCGVHSPLSCGACRRARESVAE